MHPWILHGEASNTFDELDRYFQYEHLLFASLQSMYILLPEKHILS